MDGRELAGDSMAALLLSHPHSCGTWGDPGPPACHGGTGSAKMDHVSVLRRARSKGSAVATGIKAGWSNGELSEWNGRWAVQTVAMKGSWVPWDQRAHSSESDLPALTQKHHEAMRLPTPSPLPHP